MASSLTAAHYGKDMVRVFRVVREGKWHHIVEYNVTLLLEGDIAASYTEADNSVLVATDSMKNITHYLAKVSPHILIPERFAMHLGTHMVSKYAHIHKAVVSIEQLRWKRIPVGSKDHAHSFYRDGDDKRVVRVVVDATKGKDKLIAHVASGITGLLVLKTSGSSFTKFIRDKYTTLAEVNDRIFSTSVDLTYTFSPISIPSPSADSDYLSFPIPSAIQQGSVWDDKVSETARKITLEVFATDESASVQATLYRMAQQIIRENGGISDVRYSLPNKHYIPVDMKYLGVDNVSPPKAEVFMPIAHPSGLITATISRTEKSKL